MKTTPKKVSDTYLYQVGGYEKRLYESFIKSEVLDKNDPSMENIRYDIKRGQNTSVLLKVFDSDNVVLLTNTTPQPRAFKVFAASDIKRGDNKTRIFIDVSYLIVNNGGKYEIKPKDLDVLVSYLTSALAYLIYYADPDRIIDRTQLLECGTTCFATLFSFCIDTLRISGVDKSREKCLHLGALYYQNNILGKDFTDSVESRAKKISGLNAREIEMLNVQMPSDMFKNIKTFIDGTAKILRADSLKIDNFIEKWYFNCGSGTQFATELFPAFSTLITNTYCGAYLNNQKTLEKVLGKNIVEYTVALLRLGSELK